MRIGVNALLLGNQAGYRRSGISRYIDRLLAALPSVLAGDELVVYAGRDATPPHPALRSSWRHAGWPVERPAARVAWEHTALPALMRRDRLAVFHGTMNVVPRFLPCPSVVTIHDLAFLRWPDQVPGWRYWYLAREVRSAARRASRIIAVSESTKADIVELLDVEPARVAVTHLGVDPRFHPPADEELARFREREGIVRPYVLAVGNLEPRKNLPALVRAFARIATDVPHELILVGAEGWLTGELHEAIARLQVGGRVRLPGFVADADLPAWYGGADLFVYPSLYEGFGLPTLEAMACGTPVVTSNVSSLPEIAGDAAITVDPRDEAALAETLLRVLNDDARRAELRERGRQRAAQFTWERTAAATMTVYREVGG